MSLLRWSDFKLIAQNLIKLDKTLIKLFMHKQYYRINYSWLRSDYK